MDPAELRRVFQMFDRNGDGRITRKELADSLENLGIFIPDKELAQMIEKIDVNRDGFVDMEEFGSLYQTIMEEKDEERDEEEDMREAFNVFDQNGDGFITVEELRSVLASLGLKQGRTLDECKRMIKKVDEDGDGMVNYKEFRQMMKVNLWVSASDSVSIYEALRSHGLPMGLLPKGVNNFSVQSDGRFLVYLDQACNAKFENELHYDRNVSGTLTFGQIGGLSGMAAQDLFLWFPVKEIRVDVPSSGLIYFDVGVVSKQFSLSSFDTPRDCTAMQLEDLQEGKFISETVAKSLSRKIGYRLDQKETTGAVL